MSRGSFPKKLLQWLIYIIPDYSMIGSSMETLMICFEHLEDQIKTKKVILKIDESIVLAISGSLKKMKKNITKMKASGTDVDIWM